MACRVKEETLMQQWTPGNRGRRNRKKRIWKRTLVTVGAAMMVFGLIRLIAYGLDWASSRKTAQDLRDIYHGETDFEPVLPSEEPSPEPIETPDPAAADVPVLTDLPVLPAIAYPDNPNLQISSRFKALQKESKYIVGWLTLDKLLDEPVVQKDNVYFLTRDAKGKENVNGALFLDAAVSLKTRPYTMIIYGHNMKSGAMFGSLRNFENSSYYHSSPFLTFDTMYETGRYVIFAIGNISTEEGVKNSVDFLALLSSNVRQRQTAVSALLKASMFTNTIDVQPEDQLLLLVTCVEKDDERRVVASRRIRDGEDENELKTLVERSRKKQ